jgi:uncharacterized membrane protein YebE (DUF533 family)
MPEGDAVGQGRRLNKDVFIALAAVAWADGELDPEEADAIVRAAVDEGLELEEIAEIESVTRTKIDLGALDRSGLTKEDRLFVYAVACWIARIDGRVTESENAALESLGERLGIPERPRAAAEIVAREVAEMSEGDRPARYDLARVRALIGERLKASQEARRSSGPPAA